jgi:hypothetical protein
MRFLLRLVLFFGALWVFGALVATSCVRGASVKGADLDAMPCTPVLSTGADNPHYTNTWTACAARCQARPGSTGPSVNLRTCDCVCH